MEPVELRGRVVELVPLRSDHAAGLLAAIDSDEVFAWLPYACPVDLEQAGDWIDRALADQRATFRLPFAIYDIKTGTIIGSTSFWAFDPANGGVEVGSSWFSREAWGNGSNVETKLLLLSHAFETLDLERVSFRTDILNARSQAAIERLGAVKEGVHRHEMRRRDGSWRDSVHYSILSAEWPEVKAELLERLEGRRRSG